MKEPIGVVSLAREVSLIPSTCLNIVRILSDEGLVTFNPQSKKYALGPGVLALANAFVIRNQFVQVARRHLDALSVKYRCPFAAVEESGPDHFIIVAVGDAPAGSGVFVQLSVGARFPALVSATGRCVAAFGHMTRAELRKGFSKLRWDNPPSFETWLSEVDKTRALGYAIDVGNYIQGLTILAVPAFDDKGRMLGCISAVGLREQFEGERLESLIKGLLEVARKVNSELGHGAHAG
jgi:DNA-binding IclR family transcriptional regulator